MSLIPCSACGQRFREKPCTIYWAWLRADQTRYACKQRLCASCFMGRYQAILAKGQKEFILCPNCGINTLDDMDPIYADVYLPGWDKARAELAMCPSCAVTLRNEAMVGSELLPDRQAGNGGSQPPNGPTNDPWAEIGIVV